MALEDDAGPLTERELGLVAPLQGAAAQVGHEAAQLLLVKANRRWQAMPGSTRDGPVSLAMRLPGRPSWMLSTAIRWR